MKKFFILSVILAVVFAVGWEVLSYYGSRYTGLVLYGGLVDMKTVKEFSLEDQKMITQPENELVVMHFDGKANAPREPDFYTARLMDDKDNTYKLQTAVWDAQKPNADYLVFAVPLHTSVTKFVYSEQEAFPLEYFKTFAILRYRNIVGVVSMVLIALAVILGIFKHFKGGEKKEEHVDPFDFMNRPKAA